MIALFSKSLDIHSLALRLAITNFLFSMAFETSQILLPLYASEKGASNLQVGVIVAIYGMSHFLSSFIFGRLSDIHGRVKFIRLGLGLSAVAYFTQIIAPDYLLLLVARSSVGISMGITSAAIMAFTFENKKDVGRFSSMGALGVFVGAIVAALVQNYHALFLISTICSLLAFGFSLGFKESVNHTLTRLAAPILPLGLIKKNYKVYLSFFVRQFGGFAIWSIFPLYLASIGASRFWIAIIDAINMFGQFIFMRLVGRYDPAKVYKMGFIITIIVFLIYSVANNYLQLIPVQAVLSVAWSCMFVGALNYLLTTNQEKGTATGVLYSSSFFANGLGPFLGGAASQFWGFSAVMLIGAGLTTVGLFFTRGLSLNKVKIVNP